MASTSASSSGIVFGDGDSWDGSRRVAIVTGSNTGIGLETARSLFSLGFHVILACRSKSKGISAAREIRENPLSTREVQKWLNRDEISRDYLPANVNEGSVKGHGTVAFRSLDLSDISSVDSFSNEFVEKKMNLSVLVNNAGLNTVGFKQEDTRNDVGVEMCFAVNYHGHFCLTKALLPVMESTPGKGRIVNLASVMHFEGKLFKTANEVLDAAFSSSGTKSYSHSKLAMAVFTAELQRRLESSNVSAVSVNPGAVYSDIWRNMPFLVKWLIRIVAPIIFLNTRQGCSTSVAASIYGDEWLFEEDSRKLVYLSPYYFIDWLGRWSDMFGPHAIAKHGVPKTGSGDPMYGSALWKASETIAKKSR